MAAIDLASQYSQRASAQKANGQTNIFETTTGSAKIGQPVLPVVDLWNDKEQLNREKEMLGFYYSGHPLSNYSLELGIFSRNPLKKISSMEDGAIIRVGAMVTQFKKHFDKKNRPMAFVTVEDLTGSAEMIVFADAYNKYASLLEEDSPLFIKGKISAKGEKGGNKIICEELFSLGEVWQLRVKNLHIGIQSENANEESLHQIKELIVENEGSCPIFINVRTPANGSYVIRAKKMAANINVSFTKKLANLVGRENIWIDG
jgi:DNA polymerase-3 subunit alpha